MKRYEMIYIYYGGSRFFCTDSAAAEWIIDECRKQIPSLQAGQVLYGKKGKERSGNTWWMDKLQDEQVAVMAWIVTELCHRGWEPVSVWQGNSEASSGVPAAFTLRYCREDGTG